MGESRRKEKPRIRSPGQTVKAVKDQRKHTTRLRDAWLAPAPSHRGRKLAAQVRDAWAEWELAPKNKRPSYRLLAVRYWVFTPALREELLRCAGVNEILLAKQLLRDIKHDRYPTVTLQRLAERMRKAVQRLHKQHAKHLPIIHQ